MPNNWLKSSCSSYQMTKVKKGGGDTVNMWSLNQKISGLVFIKPNFPALKYGRDMENRGSKYFH